MRRNETSVREGRLAAAGDTSVFRSLRNYKQFMAHWLIGQ